MLSLKFKDGQLVRIGHSITIKVQCLGRREVMLHFDAPKVVKIWRDKPYQKMQPEAPLQWSESIGGTALPGTWPDPLTVGVFDASAYVS